MMIAGGDSFQLCKADGASAADACRHRRCVSNCVDFVGFLFFLSFFRSCKESIMLTVVQPYPVSPLKSDL